MVGQPSANLEFEVASIKTNAPGPGFHFAVNEFSGGPGTPDPGIFRCSKCSLATLILKAFNLQPYQFPGRTSLNENTFDVLAKVPAGATPEDFSVMLQNLLKERFGLAWHFQEKTMKGYHLVVAKSGSKLKESTDHGDDRPEAPPHDHNSPLVFGTSAAYHATGRGIADLVSVLSDQLGLPVDDETGLSGKYDISLRWSGNGPTHAHSDSAPATGSWHGHDSGGGAPAGESPGLTLFDALQQQLGLKLMPAEQAATRLFVVDRVAQRPTEN
jgi:uncharacterized protein (TIGR03435 family)